MDILIKSFNRPYYLDKCLWSIFQFVEGFSNIAILDDGTPAVYLEKIKQKYPQVVIVQSELASKKQEQILQNEKISDVIPIDLWKNGVKNSSDFFVLLEDDMWFINPFNLNGIPNLLRENSVEMIKLFWLNNPILVSNTTKTISAEIEVYQPQIAIKNPLIYQSVFHSNIPKAKGIFRLLGIISDKKYLKYYQLYNVAGAIFSKDYFLALWETKQNKVKEENQLLNALHYFQKHPKAQVGKTTQEVLKTGFISAALDKDFVGDFPIERANSILNQLWLQDKIQIDTISDFDLNSLKDQIIVETNTDFFEKWLLWSNKFKQKYLDFGCKIDE